MMKGNDVPNDSTGPLSKLIYVMGGAILLYQYGIRLGIEFLLRLMRNSSHILPLVSSQGYAILMLFFVVTMAAIVLVYRPATSVWHWSPERPSRSIINIASGLAGGLAAFGASLPILLHGDKDAGFVALIITNSTSPSGFLPFLLVTIAVPITSEMVFRGIVFKTLTERVTVPAAVVASCLLFAYFSPVFGFTRGMVLGVISAALFYRTRSLIPAVIANMFLTISSGVFYLFLGFP